MRNIFARGGYDGSEPMPEVYINEDVYGDGRTLFQVMELIGFTYHPHGGSFNTLESAKRSAETLIAERRASEVVSRKQVWP